MKPFDLEAAKRGEKVVFINENNLVWPAHFIGVDSKNLPIIEISEDVAFMTKDQLRMAPKTRTVWMRMYKEPNGYIGVSAPCNLPDDWCGSVNWIDEPFSREIEE